VREQAALTPVAASHPLSDWRAALRDSTRFAQQGKVLLVDEQA
jgi:hypothetical protein